MEIEVFPKDVVLELFGQKLEIKETYLGSLMLMALMIVLALVFRFLIFPRFKTDPREMKTTQMLSEFVFNTLENFTKGAVGHLGSKLSPYILAVGAYLVGCGILELFGVRSPLSDLSATLAFGLSTFVLINYYGLREKGLIGRLKHYTKPMPIVAPFKVISDLSVPISLSCRLFGNMLGGMIVMELLKGALGGYASGIPGIAGLYFNLFHPLIQAYIFITLSLTFIDEATIKIASTEIGTEDIVEKLVATGIKVKEIFMNRLTLEEYYLSRTGGKNNA